MESQKQQTIHFSQFKKFRINIESTSERFAIKIKAWDQNNFDQTNSNNNFIVNFNKSQEMKSLSWQTQILYADLQQIFQKYLDSIKDNQNLVMKNKFQSEQRLSVSIQQYLLGKTNSLSSFLLSFGTQPKSWFSQIQKTILRQNVQNNLSENQLHQTTRLQTQASLYFKKIVDLNLSKLDSSYVIAQLINKLKMQSEKLNFLKVLQSSKFGEESVIQQQKSFSFINNLDKNDQVGDIPAQSDQFSDQLQQASKQQAKSKLEQLSRKVKFDQKNNMIKLTVNKWGQSQSIKIKLQTQELDLSELEGTDVTNGQFRQIRRLIKQKKGDKIIKLNLRGTAITDDQLEQLVKELPNLKQLDLSLCKQLSKLKMTNCQQLKKLNLGFSAITDVQLEQLVKELPKLKQLDLNACQKLNKLKMTNFQQLKKLNLSYSAISDVQLEQLPNLKQLDLNACQKLSKLKMTNCKQLKKLALRYTTITDVQLFQILNQLPLLQILDLQNCKFISLSFNLSNFKQLKQICLSYYSVPQERILKLKGELPNTKIQKQGIWFQN